MNKERLTALLSILQELNNQKYGPYTLVLIWKSLTSGLAREDFALAELAKIRGEDNNFVRIIIGGNTEHTEWVDQEIEIALITEGFGTYMFVEEVEDD